MEFRRVLFRSDVAMRMDAAHKMAGTGRIEKAVLREAFEGVLPDEILWRQQEQFSAGVGYGWIDGLKAHADSVVTDAQLTDAAARSPFNPPERQSAAEGKRVYVGVDIGCC